MSTSEHRNCPARRPKASIAEPVVTIQVWSDHLGTDIQVDFRRDPKGWQRIRDALAAVKTKIEREFEHQDQCPARPKDAGAQTSSLDALRRYQQELAGIAFEQRSARLANLADAINAEINRLTTTLTQSGVRT